MTDIPAVPSQRAEDAAALLFHTLAAHRANIARIAVRHRPPRLPKQTFSRDQLQCQATLLRLISITEAFCGDRLVDEVESLIEPNRHTAVGAVWDQAAISATSSWSDQKRALKDWLGVKLTNAQWKPVDDLVEARNSIAHGLGTLTRRQLRKKQAVVAALEAAQITLSSTNQIELTDAALETAARQCRLLIISLDNGIQHREE